MQDEGRRNKASQGKHTNNINTDMNHPSTNPSPHCPGEDSAHSPLGTGGRRGFLRALREGGPHPGAGYAYGVGGAGRPRRGQTARAGNIVISASSYGHWTTTLLSYRWSKGSNYFHMNRTLEIRHRMRSTHFHFLVFDGHMAGVTPHNYLMNR